jgi:FKBP-type peptidyl-prolyl cis-trans isomerase (trigger factor)
MSIESRLAAKKRSAKARKKAKAKAALDLALIILIPVVVLVIVFIVVNNIKSKINDYSKCLTADGYVEDYNLSKEVTLPELTYEAMNIKYEDFAPESQNIEDQIVIELKAKLPEEERPTEGDESEIKAAYIALVTDENVEKYFAENLGEDYPHTAEGYRTYVKDTLTKTSYESSINNTIVEYVVNGTTFASLPKKYVDNWTQIYSNNTKASFDNLKEIGYVTASNVYESYGGKKEFKKKMKEYATEVVKQDLALLAVYDKLGLSCSKADIDEYINNNYVTSEKSLEDCKEQYGENYMTLECKTYKAVEALKAMIPTPETEKANKDKDGDENKDADK